MNVLELTEEALFYYDAGGWIILPLALLTVILWYAIGYRFALLRQSTSRQNVRTLLDGYVNGQWSKPRNMIEEAIAAAVALKGRGRKPLRRYIEDAFWPYRSELAKFTVVIKTIVVVAPLLGLLGTVTGMIETFESLQNMQFFAQSGGIAGGISQALVTTQLGLAVAIPGLLVNGFLERRRRNIDIELEQIKNIVCSTPSGAGSNA